MLYDFNVPYPNAGSATELERIEKILDRIYSFDNNSIIALNLSIEANLQDVKPISPVAPTKFKHMRQLTRATLFIEDPKRNYMLSPRFTYPNIDIIAVRPTNLDICKHACTTLEVDMISLDLAKSRVIPGFVPAQVAVDRGIYFEICYTQSLRDPQKKFLFYNNVKRLVEVTRGHNLVFTSEALRALEIKRPTDLRILGSMYGLTHDQIEATVTINYTKLLKKSETRRLTYNATISLDQTQLFREPTKEDLSLKRKEDSNGNLLSQRAAKRAKKQQQQSKKQ